MYHGYTPDYHLIILVFAVLAWVVRQTVKAFKQVAKQIRGGSPNAAQPSLPPQNLPPQNLPPPDFAAPRPIVTPRAAPPPVYRTVPPIRAREMPRRPDAGGPVVPREATNEDLRRQERDLFSSEPAPLTVALKDSAAPSAAEIPRALFGNTDDLVRAIILQEVLGPPLSRRSARSSATVPSPR